MPHYNGRGESSSYFFLRRPAAGKGFLTQVDYTNKHGTYKKCGENITTISFGLLFLSFIRVSRTSASHCRVVHCRQDSRR